MNSIIFIVIVSWLCGGLSGFVLCLLLTEAREEGNSKTEKELREAVGKCKITGWGSKIKGG